MADKLMRAQVTLALSAGLPEDYPTNTFYFDGDDGAGNTDATYHSAIQTLLTTFYQQIDGQCLGAQVVGPAHVKLYDMRDPLPRVPEYEFDISLTPNVTDCLPSEVALCLSFQAEQQSGQSQRRRRGRVFIGPVPANRVSIVNGQSRPDSTIITTLANEAAAMENGTALVTGSMKWAVYSPTTDLTSTVDDAFNDVTDGWVDNAWDTQRRRGPKATTRTLWT